MRSAYMLESKGVDLAWCIDDLCIHEGSGTVLVGLG